MQHCIDKSIFLLFIRCGDKNHTKIARMAISFKYWNECIDPLDMQALWNVPNVSAEWEDAGETKGQKVHLSRDPDGQVYLTQTEMKVKQMQLHLRKS